MVHEVTLSADWGQYKAGETIQCDEARAKALPDAPEPQVVKPKKKRRRKKETD